MPAASMAAGLPRRGSGVTVEVALPLSALIDDRARILISVDLPAPFSPIQAVELSRIEAQGNRIKRGALAKRLPICSADSDYSGRRSPPG